MQLDVTLENMAVLVCFSSETRVRMIELLRRGPMNIKELAEALGVSSAIVTKHVQKMESAGLVACTSSSGKRGLQKRCELAVEQLILRLQARRPDIGDNANGYSVSLPVGQYSAAQVKPTCGLISPHKRIGMVDDPRYFADPERVQACHLWFGSGWIEYRIPNYLHARQRASGLTIVLEICSEAPGYNEQWPSDIAFRLNGKSIGTWTCPGDYGAVKGVYTPEWHKNQTQYGLLKTISVLEEGAFIDGTRLSGVTIGDIGLTYGEEIVFRIESPDNAANPGGVSLFGRGAGNYDQDIEVSVSFA